MKLFTAEYGRWRIALMRLVLFCLVFNILMPQPVAGLEVLQGAKPAALDPVLLKKIKTAVSTGSAQIKTTAAASTSTAAALASKTAVNAGPLKSAVATKSAKASQAKQPAKSALPKKAPVPGKLPVKTVAATASATTSAVPAKPVKAFTNVELSVLPETASAAIATDTSAEDEWEDFLCEDSEAVEFEDQDISADSVALGSLAPKPLTFSEPKRIKTPPAQVLQYAKNFWDEADHQIEKRNINISGTKTFEMKQSEVSGDIGHFSTENYDSYPGFKLDQSLHLEIDGNITENSTVHAVLDDKEDEDRRFTVNIDGPVWKFVMGDFPLALEGTEFSLFRKEVRGILAQGSFHERFKSIFLFSQSKGLARREQFRGAGQQQEFRMQASPIVQNSEKVSLDGKQLTRGSDYLVDYEDGLIKFLPHILPIEVTRWIVVEYEVADENMAFSRNLFGTRQIYTHSEGRSLAMTWLTEIDSTTPKAGVTASSTVTPMQHDLVSADADWAVSESLSIKAETAVSRVDPNRNSEATKADRAFVGNATRFGLTGKNDRAEGEIAWRRIDKDFKVVGREGGVLELGERGLVNDIMSGRARLNYKFTGAVSAFADGEQSETNLDNDRALSAIDYRNYNSGFIWTASPDTRLEVRGGRQFDRENGPTTSSDLTRDTAAVVYDRKIGKLNTQAKVNKTGYDDALNLASDSEVLEMNFTMGAKADETMSWNAGVSRIAVEDELVKAGLRSETRNYNLDLNYEPNRVFNARGIFQWRREDDFLANSRADTEIADSQLRYEPTRDLRTQRNTRSRTLQKLFVTPILTRQNTFCRPVCQTRPRKRPRS